MGLVTPEDGCVLELWARPRALHIVKTQLITLRGDTRRSLERMGIYLYGVMRMNKHYFVFLFPNEKKEKNLEINVEKINLRENSTNFC